MKKVTAALLLTLFLGGCTSMPSRKIATAPSKNWKTSENPYSDNVVCSLKASASAIFKDEKISIESNIDNEPTVLTFINLDSDTPSIIGNLGDKSALLKNDQGSTMYLIENTGIGNMNIFTLFRDKNIMLMSKQYNFIGMPFGLLMIGDCLSGS